MTRTRWQSQISPSPTGQSSLEEAPPKRTSQYTKTVTFPMVCSCGNSFLMVAVRVRPHTSFGSGHTSVRNDPLIASSSFSMLEIDSDRRLGAQMALRICWLVVSEKNPNVSMKKCDDVYLVEFAMDAVNGSVFWMHRVILIIGVEWCV